MIKVEGLWKTYDRRPALQGVTWTAEAGQRTALVGPNGSGKTTLLRCLLGLVRYEGSLRIAGLDPLADHAAVQQRVAYVPQRAPALQVPVGELVTFWSTMRRCPRENLLAAADLLGLDAAPLFPQRFPTLSGGMQQKLLAAMALASACDVLLLDEPTANLDPPARAAFFDALGARTPAPTVVLSSHRLEELRRLVDRVLVLRDGRVAFDDAVAAFLADPALATAAGLDGHRDGPVVLTPLPSRSTQ